jgi:hypothetical protein
MKKYILLPIIAILLLTQVSHVSVKPQGRWNS